jgi:hypothetical protein
MLEILKAYSWKTIHLDNPREIVAKGDMANSVQDIVVQICLTYMFVMGSNMAHVIVPETILDVSIDHLSCFFKFVMVIGARDHCKLLQVSHIRDMTHEVYDDAIKRKKIHPLFINKSGCNWQLSIRNTHASTDVYVVYQPANTNRMNAPNREDPLLQYVLSMPTSELVGFPIYLLENEIDTCELLYACAARGFRVFLNGRMGDDMRFMSHSVTILPKPGLNG